MPESRNQSESVDIASRKSVVIPERMHRVLVEQAARSCRSLGGQLSWLIRQEENRRRE